jgi:two-component system, NtrC family, response regulator HydG
MPDNHKHNEALEMRPQEGSAAPGEGGYTTTVPSSSPDDCCALYALALEQEKFLRDTLENYKTILDEIEDGVGETDLRGCIKYINTAGCRLWGYTREEMIGTNIQAYMDAEGRKRIREGNINIYQSGLPGRYTHEIIRKDGTRRILEDSVSLIRNADNVITGFRGVQRDVTDKVEAERQLAAHRRHLEAIFGSVKDAIITVDPELRVIGANKSTEDICGIAVRDITGAIFSESLSLCSKACCGVLRQTLEQKTTIKEYRIECGHQKHNRQLASVTTSPLLDPQGEFKGAVLVIRDLTLLRDLERELRELHKFQNIIGHSKKMQEIYRLLEDLANLETTVLVTGESGTGKELVAKALHYSGQRTLRPFVTVNCSALAESLLESELFGHVRGAFTGAIKDKQGRFEAAHGGTILLDEIGDISPLIQLKLLRVLQEKVYERVGESIPQKTDVRVIACTNKNLKQKVLRGEFREDLYYRLMVVEVALPPLRDRLEDLPLLTDHFRNIFNERFKKDIDGISREVLNRFMEYSWPGNIRELEHAVEHAFILCRGRVIALEHLPTEIRSYEKSGKVAASRSLFRGQRQQVGAEEIRNALRKSGGNKAKAARALGIDRRTVYRKIARYDIVDGEQ